MKKILVAIAAVALFACSEKKESGATETATAAEETLISEVVGPEAFITKYKETNGAVLIDLRTPPELEGGIVEGAINVDFNDESFRSKLETLDKDTPYFVYCAKGGRSGKAALVMKELKFKEVYDMDGGFTAWTAQGLPVAAKPAD